MTGIERDSAVRGDAGARPAGADGVNGAATPLVSVCIGAYNREAYIRETLDSVLSQTYPNIEVIVVDDASTDATAEVAASYGPRVRLIRLERNSGRPAVPRNRAMADARGEYLAFLDSDDVWLPRKIECQVGFLRSHPDIGCCHTAVELIDERSQGMGVRHDGAIPGTGRCFRELLRHCFISISSVMVTRTLIEDIGGFNEAPVYRAREDYEWFLRIAARQAIGFLPDVLARYRMAASGISRAVDRWRCMPQDVPMYAEILKRRDLWTGVVARADVVGACLENAGENCQFWRDRGHSGRSLWFAWQMLRFNAVSQSAWSQLARSLGRCVLGRNAAK